MILQALVKHYETLLEQGKVSRQGWCQAKVSYALDIDREGKLLGIISLKQEEVRGKKTAWVPQMAEVPGKWWPDLRGYRQTFCVIIPNICWGLTVMEAGNAFRVF